jgi:hypothetical protein
MRGPQHLGFFCLACSLIGCGGAGSSPLLGQDAGNSDTGTGDATVDSPMGCDVTKCVPNVPEGFTLVTLSTSMCQSGWSSTDVVSTPTAGDGTCTCACDVTTPPTCNTGTLNRYLDITSAATCTTAATTLYPDGTPCELLTAPIQLYGYHYAVDALTPVGGACTYDATVDTTKITSTSAHVCAPPASCVGAICGGNICVSEAGDVDCPTGFPAKTLVGTSATAACSACGTGACTVTGTCTGTLSMFTDQACTTGQANFPADGTCNANAGTLDGLYYSYSYTGSVSAATCTGTAPTSMPTPSLNAPTTVCCQQ